MLKRIVRFFREEKVYFVLLILVVSIYGFFWLRTLVAPPPETSGSAPTAIHAYEEAEARIQRQVDEAGSFYAYLQRHPEIESFFYYLTLFLLLAIAAGLLVDLGLVFSRRLRDRITHPGLPQSTRWEFAMLLKLILLFVSANLIVSLAIRFLHDSLGLDLSENFYMLFHTTVVDCLCFAFIAYLIQGAEGTLWDLGLWVPDGKFFREVLVGLGGYIAVVPLFMLALVGVIFLAQLLAYEPPPHPLVHIFLEEEKRSPALILYSILLATCVGPFLEELFFRGFCYPIFKKRFGMGWAMVLSAGLFAFIHENSFAFWPIFVLGLGLAYLFEKRKSIVAPVVLHIVHNSIIILYFFLTKKMVMDYGGL